jgi:hypothetical protein
MDLSESGRELRWYRLQAFFSKGEYEKIKGLKEEFYKAGILKRNSTSEFIRFCVFHVIDEIEKALKERGP